MSQLGNIKKVVKTKAINMFNLMTFLSRFSDLAHESGLIGMRLLKTRI
jgi:hypothetical protein